MVVELTVQTWAEQQFGECDLGDTRRTARAVTTAALFAAHPSGSTPEQTEFWAECKGAYRLFSCNDVTFEGLAEPHWKRTRSRTEGHYLLLGDTTTISFDGDRQIEGMGIISSGTAKGYLLHSSLMVSPDGREVVGLAGGTIYYRKRVPAKETNAQRRKRGRESEIWGQVIDQVGPPPDRVRFTHVFDRGADNFEVFCHLIMQQNDWVIRAAQLTRRVDAPDGRTMELSEYLETLPLGGTYRLEVPAAYDQKARTAEIEVRFGRIGLRRSKILTSYVRDCGISLVTMSVVEVREINPPKGQKPLHWVLLTSHSVETFAAAYRVIGYYEQRPLIEEFHKALKTGCRLEGRLYETSHAWENVTAMLSITAVRLLQLKCIAKTNPEQPAEEVVPRKWIGMLSRVRRGKPIETVRDFVRQLGGLGGHLGRKGDGEPGWITLWRGVNKLNLLLRGAETKNKRCG